MPAPSELETALAASARDLAATGVPDSVATTALDQAATTRRWWVERWPAGAEHLRGLVAQDVQEAIQTEHDRHWPHCLEHPDHALVIEPDLGPDPFWVCERTGLPQASVGNL